MLEQEKTGFFPDEANILNRNVFCFFSSHKDQPKFYLFLPHSRSLNQPKEISSSRHRPLRRKTLTQFGIISHEEQYEHV